MASCNPSSATRHNIIPTEAYAMDRTAHSNAGTHRSARLRNRGRTPTTTATDRMVTMTVPANVFAAGSKIAATLFPVTKNVAPSTTAVPTTMAHKRNIRVRHR